MGYWETEGIVLRRRDQFETDQGLRFLTRDRGVLSVRVPHGQKSQKTHCGRLEPPNHIRARLYQSREDGPWTLSESNIETVFAELMGREDVKKELWPLLSLFDDLFPEGHDPARSYDRFLKALQFMEQGFRPAVLVSVRLLAQIRSDVGIAISVSRCVNCNATESERWCLDPERGLSCRDCSRSTDHEFSMNEETRRTFEWVINDTWEELTARSIKISHLGDVESLLYRLFHYHFEISLETLEVRNTL